MVIIILMVEMSCQMIDRFQGGDYYRLSVLVTKVFVTTVDHTTATASHKPRKLRSQDNDRARQRNEPKRRDGRGLRYSPLAIRRIKVCANGRRPKPAGFRECKGLANEKPLPALFCFVVEHSKDLHLLLAPPACLPAAHSCNSSEISVAMELYSTRVPMMNFHRVYACASVRLFVCVCAMGFRPLFEARFVRQAASQEANLNKLHLSIPVKSVCCRCTGNFDLAIAAPLVSLPLPPLPGRACVRAYE